MPLAVEAARTISLVAFSTFASPLHVAAQPYSRDIVKRSDASTGFIAALVIIVFLLVAICGYMSLFCRGNSKASYNYETDGSRPIRGPSHWLYVLSRGRYGVKSQPPELLPEFELKSPVDSGFHSQTFDRPARAGIMQPSSAVDIPEPWVTSVGSGRQRQFREKLRRGLGDDDGSVPRVPTSDSARNPALPSSRALSNAHGIADSRAPLLLKDQPNEEHHRAVGETLEGENNVLTVHHRDRSDAEAHVH